MTSVVPSGGRRKLGFSLGFNAASKNTPAAEAGVGKRPDGPFRWAHPCLKSMGWVRALTLLKQLSTWRVCLVVLAKLGTKVGDES